MRNEALNTTPRIVLAPTAIPGERGWVVAQNQGDAPVRLGIGRAPTPTVGLLLAPGDAYTIEGAQEIESPLWACAASGTSTLHIQHGGSPSNG